MRTILEQERNQYKDEYTKIFSENLKLRSDIVQLNYSISQYERSARDSKKKHQALEIRNGILRSQVALANKGTTESRKRIAELKKLLKFCSEDLTAIKKLFTPSQLSLLRDPQRYRSCWSKEDMTEAIELYDCSSDAYELLRGKGFPLPATSTVKAWKEFQHSNNPDKPENPVDTDAVNLEYEPRSKTMRYSQPDSNSNPASTLSDEEIEFFPVNENEDSTIILESEDESDHEPNKEAERPDSNLEPPIIEQEIVDLEDNPQDTPTTNEGEEIDVDVVGDCVQEYKGAVLINRGRRMM